MASTVRAIHLAPRLLLWFQFLLKHVRFCVPSVMLFDQALFSVPPHCPGVSDACGLPMSKPMVPHPYSLRPPPPLSHKQINKNLTKITASSNSLRLATRTS